MALLEIKQLSFESEGKKILEDIQFTVENGEFISITGPSGSGKSTLLKIIATILSKDRKSVV